MNYDAIIIGAGLSGLSAGALLAKRGLAVAVLEHASAPGGSCGVFKRKNAVFDQGAAMLYGFGEKGFNSHRFLFNCLEEPIQMIRHNLLYTIDYRGHRIKFYPNMDKFTDELAQVFPGQKENIKRFYRDMHKLYKNVISGTPSYTTADETNPREALRSLLRHPLSYAKFLSYLNISAKQLLEQYFTDPEIFHFFDKLTSTYCYATVEEAPAVLAAVMFIDNHEGGSFYPAGSTLHLPGKLEKVIEERGGEMFYHTTATEILFNEDRPVGVKTQDNRTFYAPHVIYSGTVWNLYGKLLPQGAVTDKEKKWVASQAPTYPSSVLYCLVKKEAIPPDACPIEMLIADPEKIDENEITLYILSIDDGSLCDPAYHTVIAIGPSFRNWAQYGQSPEAYQQAKTQESRRMLKVLENRFPGFQEALVYHELASPETIRRYTMKNGGAVAGPKQMLGQHMLKRQHIRTRWPSLLCCGESTVMGTGTPTVTTSGIAAANAVLTSLALKPYVWRPGMKNYVEILDPPAEKDRLYDFYPDREADVMRAAARCLFCIDPACCPGVKPGIPDIMRRCACGNFSGAAKAAGKFFSHTGPEPEGFWEKCRENCVQEEAVKIGQVMNFLL